MLKALSKIKLDSKRFEIVVLGDSHNLEKNQLFRKVQF